MIYMSNVFLCLILFAILAAILSSPWFKGITGEFIVNISAKLMLDKNEYHLIKNVTLVNSRHNRASVFRRNEASTKGSKTILDTSFKTSFSPPFWS
jgi:hypothetical protein